MAANRDATDPRGLCRWLMEQEHGGWPSYRQPVERTYDDRTVDGVRLPLVAAKAWKAWHACATACADGDDEAAKRTAWKALRLHWQEDEDGRWRRTKRGILWKAEEVVNRWGEWAGSTGACQAALVKAGVENPSGMCDWLSGDAAWHIPSDRDIDKALVVALLRSGQEHTEKRMRLWKGSTVGISERDMMADILPSDPLTRITKAAYEDGEYIVVEVGAGLGAVGKREAHEAGGGITVETVAHEPVAYRFARGAADDWTIPRALMWLRERGVVMKRAVPFETEIAALTVSTDAHELFESIADDSGWVGEARKTQRLAYWGALPTAVTKARHELVGSRIVVTKRGDDLTDPERHDLPEGDAEHLTHLGTAAAVLAGGKADIVAVSRSLWKRALAVGPGGAEARVLLREAAREGGTVAKVLTQAAIGSLISAVAANRCAGGACAIRKSVPIKKIDRAKQIVYGEVYRPYEVDSQGDWMTPEDIEDMAHNWLMHWRLIGIQHNYISRDTADPVESGLTRVPEPDFPTPGTWVLAVKVRNPTIWKDVEAGRITGFSLGGEGVREPGYPPLQWQEAA